MDNIIINNIINHLEERKQDLENRQHFKRGLDDDLTLGRIMALEEVLDYLKELI
ncbi:MAG: hypothetical protein IPJ51_10670 [Saprospiraceae bacterium]|nr:hypothetical protein [Saprospiraceae bacterium]